MADFENTRVITNPYDKLFRETWSDLNNARTFLKHSLPDQVLKVLDLSNLAISKDSFIGKELSDYYSDMPYRVRLSKDGFGFIYILFQAYF